MKRWVLWLVLMLTVCLAGGCSAAKEKKKNAEVHYILGVSFLQEQRPTQALKEFLLAEESSPDDAEVQAGLGQAYHLKGAYGDAETHYLRALELDGNDPQVQNNLAALYLDMERWNDAIRYFERAASNLLFKNPEVALSGIGYAYFQQGKYLEAIKAYRDALAYGVPYPRANFGMGEAYYALGKTPQAIEAFQKALEIAPDFLQARYKLGLAYMKARQKDKAVEAFQEVVQKAPASETGRLAADYLKLLRKYSADPVLSVETFLRH
jgi:tetratricopeptide (TPR) repeat protein